MVFEPLFAIFMILGGGYIAKKAKILKQKQTRMFFDFAIIFATPCLIFNRIYHLQIDLTLISLIFTGFISTSLAALISFAIGKICKFSKATLVSVVVLSSFGNTLFVGMPIVEGVIGTPSAIGEVIFYDALAGALPISLFVPLILSLGSNEKFSLINSVKKIFSFPPFYGLLLGIGLKIIDIPDFIFKPIIMLGDAATPVALFAIGLSLGFGAIKSSYKQTIVVILCKMIIAPLIFIILFKSLGFEITNSLKIAFLETTMPTATIVCAMVMKAKMDSNLAVSSVAFGLIFSIISMPFWVYIMQNLG